MAKSQKNPRLQRKMMKRAPVQPPEDNQTQIPQVNQTEKEKSQSQPQNFLNPEDQPTNQKKVKVPSPPSGQYITDSTEKMGWIQVLNHLATKPEPEAEFENLVKRNLIKNEKTCREQLRQRGILV